MVRRIRKGTGSQLPLTLKALKYFHINHGDQQLFSILNYHKCFTQLFPIHLTTYVMSPLAQGIFVNIWPNLELREGRRIYSPSCSIKSLASMTKNKSYSLGGGGGDFERHPFKSGEIFQYQRSVHL